VVACHHLSPDLELYLSGSVPLGNPVPNNRLYLLDSNQQPVPIGIPGELCVGGIQVARGYLNRPELTAEKFMPDPFSAVAGARLYRTGDLARYLPGGAIEYLGRTDHQVKIRGFRIELGEIETALEEHDSVGQAVVMAREDLPGDKRLVAYIVPEIEQTPSAGELRQYLKEKLPEYMVPNAFVTLEKFPLTPNGKIDRRALPVPEADRQTEAGYIAPRNEVEEIIAGIWQELLNVKNIGVNDSFFEVGGHSLLAIRAVSQLNKAFQIAIPLRSFFESSTIAGLSQIIEKSKNSGAVFSTPAIVPISRESRRVQHST
jgi:acyl carrier protein